MTGTCRPTAPASRTSTAARFHHSSETGSAPGGWGEGGERGRSIQLQLSSGRAERSSGGITRVDGENDSWLFKTEGPV